MVGDDVCSGGESGVTDRGTRKPDLERPDEYDASSSDAAVRFSCDAVTNGD